MAADGFLNAFKQGIQGELARGFMFYAKIISSPVTIPTNQKFLVKSTTIPASTLEAIKVPYQGMEYKMGGIHTYADWSCAFNADNSFDIRQAFIDWQDIIHSSDTNVQGVPSDYFGEIEVQMLSPFGVDQVTYTTTLHHAWPLDVGAVTLGYETKDIANFEVSFSMNWITSTQS